MAKTAIFIKYWCRYDQYFEFHPIINFVFDVNNHHSRNQQECCVVFNRNPKKKTFWHLTLLTLIFIFLANVKQTNRGKWYIQPNRNQQPSVRRRFKILCFFCLIISIPVWWFLMQFVFEQSIIFVLLREWVIFIFTLWTYFDTFSEYIYVGSVLFCCFFCETL